MARINYNRTEDSWIVDYLIEEVGQKDSRVVDDVIGEEGGQAGS